MKIAGLFAAVLSVATFATVTAGTTERSPSPREARRPSANSTLSTSANQLPILFIVDGVRYEQGRVPLLSAEQIAAVKVIKGHRALERYGPDASYGVVVITTKMGSIRRA